LQDNVPKKSVAKKALRKPTSKGKSSKKQHTQYLDLLELKDIKGKQFYTYNNLNMIAWLRKDTFCRVLQYSMNGVVEVVSPTSFPL